MTTLRLLVCAAALLAFASTPVFAKENDPVVKETPCVAVMASFPEELESIVKVMAPDPSKLETQTINGIKFRTLEGKGVRYLFFLTGMSLVNAASSTQLVLDRFSVEAVFFTGIAGGVNPAYSPGDVVIPAKWYYHGEAGYFNETAPGKFDLPGWFKQKYPNFGMIFPDDVYAIREGMDKHEQVSNFPADERLMALAQKALAGLPPLKTGQRDSKVSFGGQGVSATVFCDNAEYRKWVFTAFKADCLDMESTAIAQVCWANKKPCLIVRGLSDLAGGQTGKNQMEEYLMAASDHSAAVLVKILQSYEPVVAAKAAVGSEAKP